MSAIAFVYSLSGLIAHQGETYDLVPEKASWPEGVWTKEPDAVVFEHRGFWCAVARHPVQGNLVGYVRVPKGHPWYGATDRQLYDAGVCVDVHGGLSYTAFGEDGDTDGWYLGFDCAHYLDFSPNPRCHFGEISNGVYRDVGYVYEQCLSLARQAEAAEPLPRMLDATAN